MPSVRCTALSSMEGPHFELLAAAGFETVRAPQGHNFFDPDAMVDFLQPADAVIAGAEPYTRSMLERLPKLRAICRSGVGFDAIDLAACDELDIVVTTTPGVNHHSVAEHAIALVMATGRGYPEVDTLVRDGSWSRERRPRIRGSVLGLVGLGRIGRAVATRALGLGMEVIAYDPYPPVEFCDLWNVEMTGLDDLLGRSDFVSLHLPVMADTRHVMNADSFAKMKENSVFINTARGALVDETALCDALRSGRLRAAGLDVFETEPLPEDSPLREFRNVLLSAHVAGLDSESIHDTLVMVAETIISLRDGGWPVECIRNHDGRSDWSWDNPRRDA